MDEVEKVWTGAPEVVVSYVHSLTLAFSTRSKTSQERLSTELKKKQDLLEQPLAVLWGITNSFAQTTHIVAHHLGSG